MFLFSLVGIPHQIESYSFSIDKLYSGDHSLEGTALTLHPFLQVVEPYPIANKTMEDHVILFGLKSYLRLYCKLPLTGKFVKEAGSDCENQPSSSGTRPQRAWKLGTSKTREETCEGKKIMDDCAPADFFSPPPPPPMEAGPRLMKRQNKNIFRFALSKYAQW